MSKIYSVFLFLTIVISAGAQENSFMVYSFKGNVSVVENKVDLKAKVGKILNSSAFSKNCFWLNSHSYLQSKCNVHIEKSR